MISFSLLEPNVDNFAISDAWENMRPKMQKTLRFWDGAAEIEDIDKLILDGKLQVLLAYFINTTLASMLIERLEYPRKTYLNIVFFSCVQDAENVISLIGEPLKYYIKLSQFDGITMKARPGLVRTLKKLGMTSKLTGMTWNG